MADVLQTWSPFRQLERFRKEMDDLFDRFTGGEGDRAPWFPTSSSPALESFVEGDKMIIRADLPGIEPNDVEVTVSGDTLTLRGSRQAKFENKGRDYLHREVSYGSFERSITLPEGVKSDDVKASYRNGVLELTMPVPKELSPRKVPIEIEHKKE
jgi:HSP20 family protein